jgi:orotidine-5'-phosphate decarboxylase
MNMADDATGMKAATVRARLQPKERVAVAFDVDTMDAAMRLRERLGDTLGLAKVGSALYVREGMALVRALKKSGVRVFLDLKFHDIPSVVGMAVEKATAEGVDYLTVHAAGGRAMIAEAARAARDAGGRTKILAVTVLTSLDLDAWRAGASPTETSIESAVRRLAKLAVDAGADGLVGSARETAILREAGPDAILVTPGITTGTTTSSDQARTMTVKDAVRTGTDILVVGRGVWAAPDPRGALEGIVAEVAASAAS